MFQPPETCWWHYGPVSRTLLPTPSIHVVVGRETYHMTQCCPIWTSSPSRDETSLSVYVNHIFMPSIYCIILHLQIWQYTWRYHFYFGILLWNQYYFTTWVDLTLYKPSTDSPRIIVQGIPGITQILETSAVNSNIYIYIYISLNHIHIISWYINKKQEARKTGDLTKLQKLTRCNHFGSHQWSRIC